MKVTIIAGARPNFMKIAPLMRAIKAAKAAGKNITARLVYTGSDEDKSLEPSLFTDLDMPRPDVYLHVDNTDFFQRMAGILVAFARELEQHPAQVVLVVDDLTPTMACSIVAKKKGIKVAHLVAGTRSFDMDMPKEVNSMITDGLSDYLFTAGMVANRNLNQTGTEQAHVHFVGNILIDTLRYNRTRLQRPVAFSIMGLKEKEYLLLTLNKHSLLNKDTTLKAIFRTILEKTDKPIVAPEIMYQPELGKYYLFTSYDPLMTTYNVRVAYSDSPEGPFVDFYGEDIKDTTNNVPILTAPYRFENHPGWAGTAHCGLIDAGDGRYFMTHQGRLSPQNQLMDLHVREVFFTVNGWPVVSPERYAGTAPRSFTKEDLAGEWEIIRLQEPPLERSLEAGQIMWGEGDLRNGEQALSARVVLEADGSVGDATWDFNVKKQLLTIKTATEDINNLIIFAGHDWENETETILFTGLDAQGHSVWGKRIN